MSREAAIEKNLWLTNMNLTFMWTPAVKRILIYYLRTYSFTKTQLHRNTLEQMLNLTGISAIINLNPKKYIRRV